MWYDFFVICCVTFAGSHFWETAQWCDASRNWIPSLLSIWYLDFITYCILCRVLFDFCFWFRWLALVLISEEGTDQWWSLLFEQLRAQILLSVPSSGKVGGTHPGTGRPNRTKYVLSSFSVTIFKVSSANSLSIVFLCHYFWINIILRNVWGVFLCEDCVHYPIRFDSVSICPLTAKSICSRS